MVSFLILLRSLRVDILKQLFISGSVNIMQLSPEGEVNSGGIKQISWIKIKKKLFVNKRHHLVSSGRSRGGAQGTRPPPLFLGQAEARRAEKNFLETSPSPLLIRHWLEFVYVPIDSVSGIIFL